MRTSKPSKKYGGSSRSLRSVLIPALIVCALQFTSIACPDLSPAEETHLNILFISSNTNNSPSQAAFESGLDEILGYSEERHNLYFEFMDASRLDVENYIPIYGEYLKKKYEGIQFDVVMGWASTAIRFLKDNETLFSSEHRIYLGDTEPEAADRQLEKHITSLAVREDWNAYLTEVLRLEKPESIYVIGTTEGGGAQSRIRLFKESVTSLSFQGKVEFLLDQPLEQVAGVLESLPRKGTVAIYLLMFSDGHGNNMTPYRIAQVLSDRSAVPIFCNWESLIGSGIVGGHLISQVETGKEAARIILSPHTVKPVLSVVPMRYVYDWKALKRWGIPDEKLPRGAVVVNRPQDIWSVYRWQITVGLGVILGLSLLSFFLARALKLRNIAVDELAAERKNLARTVEERTRELVQSNRNLTDSEERFRNLSDAAFEGIIFIDNGLVVDANTTSGEMLGYSVSEIVNRPVLDFVEPGEREKVKNNIGSGYAQPYETKGLKKDGTALPLQIHGKTFSYKGRMIRVTAMRDLTELKKSEEEIKILRGILPICASCKKIRDDQGYWNQIEKYVRDRSEAEFSHSICPDCIKKLYPDYTG